MLIFTIYHKKNKQKKSLTEVKLFNKKYKTSDYTKEPSVDCKATPEVKYIVSGWKPASTKA